MHHPAGLALAQIPNQLRQLPRVEHWGVLEAVHGTSMTVTGFGNHAAVGDRVTVRDARLRVPGEVVAFADGRVTVMTEGRTDGLTPGARVTLARATALYPCQAWLGRVIDGAGRPLDGRGPLPHGDEAMSLRRPPPEAFSRRLIGRRLETGIRTLDSFVPLCRGQRLGIFAASGVGKSTLMGMLARHIDTDVVVVGLIGERGREVREFIEVTLSQAGLQRAVVVVATSDQPPLARRRAAYATLSVAEWFRAQGMQVLCMLDSVTRLAHAQREIGLAAGEPATARSYTPSVFAELASLLERAGPGAGAEGDITGVFTVLVDGDDHDEPISDAVRGILDGHLVLDRRIGETGRWPAIDILRSVSRALPRCHTAEENALLAEARRLLGGYDNMAEMIRLGVYRTGSDPLVDRAILKHPEFERFFGQSADERTPSEQAFAALKKILESGQDAAPS